MVLPISKIRALKVTNYLPAVHIPVPALRQDQIPEMRDFFFTINVVSLFTPDFLLLSRPLWRVIHPLFFLSRQDGTEPIVKDRLF
ncbi:hypothetical protein [Tatumella ptyseos]|uniref:hypothetical protein n=1 Tax=Tatumella ptyseos TaxID=82987 RepID=UPI0011AB5114|nr:hypothetical protein [Tatumella ptyseos]